jgi:hypothetical protein
VNGLLENLGSGKVCGVSVGVSGADKFYSIWPEWVERSAWDVDFQPKQVSVRAAARECGGLGTKQHKTAPEDKGSSRRPDRLHGPPHWKPAIR